MVASIDDKILPGSARADSIGLSVARVPLDAPWEWLARGWRDFCAVPILSIAYGALFTLIAWALSFGLASMGGEGLVPMLAAGFVLLGPIAASGLYEVSRRREAGYRIALPHVFGLGAATVGRLAQLGIVLFLAFFAWVLMAFLLLMLFLGTAAVPPASDLVQTLLFTKPGLGLLFCGTFVGALIAATVFCISTVAAPLLLANDIDLVSAIVTSVRAVRRNIGPMLLWAGLIAGFMVLGLITLFAGLVVALPLLGYASWHAFRALVPEGYESSRGP